MFNFLEISKTKNTNTNTNTGRKMRKSYAKDAKKTGEGTLQASRIVGSDLIFSGFFKFDFDFFASFAQLLRLLRPVFVFLFIASSVAAYAQFQNIGRPATPAEVKAWDIDIRPDFKGLPPGKGSVAQGEVIWEAQCAACHGSFGESNEVFTPIAGGITAKDIETGKASALVLGANTPQRTTMMKLSSLSTLWDYVNRAMPWTAPKSLKPDEVYAVTAYMLNLGNVIPADFTLSDQNIRDVQNRLPNRNGKTTAHAMWTNNELGGSAKPDAQGSACMKDCKAEPSVASFLPDFARNAHGNLAEQSRGFGPMRGANTTVASQATILKPNQPLAQINSAPAAINSGASAPQVAQGSASAVAKPSAAATPVASSAAAAPASLKLADVNPLLQKYACAACHGVDNKIVGPSFKEIVAKQGKRVDAQAYLAGKIKSGGQGVYGQIPMPAQSISELEAAKVAQWLVQGAAK